MIVRGRLYSLMPRGRLAQVLMAVAAAPAGVGATLGIVRPGDAGRPPASIPVVRNAGGGPPIADLTPDPTAAPEPTPKTHRTTSLRTHRQRIRWSKRQPAGRTSVTPIRRRPVPASGSRRTSRTTGRDGCDMR